MTKRDQILNATLEVIHEHGLQSASMAQIIAKAGVATGTVYNHFSGKEELVKALYRELVNRLGTQLLEGFDPSASPRQRFKMVWTNFVQCCLQSPREFQFVENYAHTPYIASDWKSDDVGMMSTLFQLFEDIDEHHSTKGLPPEVSLKLVIGGLSALAKGHLSGKLELDDAMAALAIDACWDALMA